MRINNMSDISVVMYHLYTDFGMHIVISLTANGVTIIGKNIICVNHNYVMLQAKFCLEDLPYTNNSRQYIHCRTVIFLEDTETQCMYNTDCSVKGSDSH